MQHYFLNTGNVSKHREKYDKDFRCMQDYHRIGLSLKQINQKSHPMISTLL